MTLVVATRLIMALNRLLVKPRCVLVIHYYVALLRLNHLPTTMAMNDDIVFEGGDWKVIDCRDINYDDTELAPGDHENGTEEHARVWARDFYLANEAFLISCIHTRQFLAIFFKTWYSSRAADDTRANVPPRRFNQILFALCNDKQVLHLRGDSVVWACKHDAFGRNFSR